MFHIKLREQGKRDYYTAAYPDTTIGELKSTCFPLQWERGDTIIVCLFSKYDYFFLFSLFYFQNKQNKTM